MIDRDWLARWLEPRHLEERAMDAYRLAFESHPSRLMVLEHVMREDLVESVGGFLADGAVYKPKYGLYSVRGRISAREWSRAEASDRFFRFSNLEGVRDDHQLSRDVGNFLKLRMLLVDPRFKAYLERITGMNLGLSTQPYAHAFGELDFLNRHDDDFENRSLTLVQYFSKGWRPEFGGALHMIDRDGNEEKLEANYNSMVLFDVSMKTEHFIAPISAPSGQQRLSIGCWFHKPAAGTGSAE